MQSALPSSAPKDKIRYINDLKIALGEAIGVVACLFILPDADCYIDASDPKLVLRNAFACTNRVVQFITPKDQPDPHRIDHAVYDLYRQIGVTTLINVDKASKQKNRLYSSCVGMHTCTQVQGISNKGRFLPVFVEVDVLTGRTRVECSAFEEYRVNYREACIQMAKLFWNTSLEQRCIDASRAPAKQKLIELRNAYPHSDSGVVLLISADGNSRPLWGGISDKAIGAAELLSDYVPRQIDVGSMENPYAFSLADTGVRIIRIRSNAEVPDYYTAQKAGASPDEARYSSASGLFLHDKVYWSIAAKPNDPRYNKSYNMSKIDNPARDYAEKDMMEFYPLQLQPSDTPLQWVQFVNALRLLPIQYDKATVLPLPLHLAKCLTEYLFKP
jgi:hypothetical protein